MNSPSKPPAAAYMMNISDINSSNPYGDVQSPMKRTSSGRTGSNGNNLFAVDNDTMNKDYNISSPRIGSNSSNNNNLSGNGLSSPQPTTTATAATMYSPSMNQKVQSPKFSSIVSPPSSSINAATTTASNSNQQRSPAHNRINSTGNMDSPSQMYKRMLAASTQLDSELLETSTSSSSPYQATRTFSQPGLLIPSTTISAPSIGKNPAPMLVSDLKRAQSPVASMSSIFSTKNSPLPNQFSQQQQYQQQQQQQMNASAHHLTSSPMSSPRINKTMASSSISTRYHSEYDTNEFHLDSSFVDADDGIDSDEEDTVKRLTNSFKNGMKHMGSGNMNMQRLQSVGSSSSTTSASSSQANLFASPRLIRKDSDALSTKAYDSPSDKYRKRALSRGLQPGLSATSSSSSEAFRALAGKEARVEYGLSDFEMLATLGTGTFGRVRLVRCLKDQESIQPSFQGAGASASAARSSAPAFYAMKILKKSEIIRLKQVDHILSEVKLLSMISHPFIVNMRAHFQDKKKLYMVLEYVPGGELFSYLRRQRYLPNDAARFYTSEIVLAYEYLHAKDIAYRDLKPENLLLTKTGHIKIADFGFAKIVTDRTWTLCGTPEYLAPEIIQSKGHNKSVDWWALGILVFEMLAGYPPFYDENPFGIYTKILAGVIEWPRHIDARAKLFISGLLTADLTKRLGCLRDGAADVKKSMWFAKLDWQSVYDRAIPVSSILVVILFFLSARNHIS